MTNRYVHFLVHVFHVGSISIGLGGQSLFAHVFFTPFTTHHKYTDTLTQLHMTNAPSIGEIVLTGFCTRQLGRFTHVQDCPTLIKGSKWQITQIWESDVFRLDLACSTFSLSRNTHPAGRYLSEDVMILHRCQCTWQTHFANLWKI